MGLWLTPWYVYTSRHYGNWIEINIFYLWLKEIFSLPNSANNIQQFSAADLESIKEMFPTFDTEIVTSILESKNGNKDATIETLLQMVADS